MQINLTSIIVNDQEKALLFYTNILGFEKKRDMPVGEYRWVSVVSPEGPEGIELVLEPIGFPPSRIYQKALFDAGIPITAFISKDIHNEFNRLSNLGVKFRGEPKKMGPITSVLFDDTCGNLIDLVQPN